jgi:hypothetical protein
VCDFEFAIYFCNIQAILFDTIYIAQLSDLLGQKVTGMLLNGFFRWWVRIHVHRRLIMLMTFFVQSELLGHFRQQKEHSDLCVGIYSKPR